MSCPARRVEILQLGEIATVSRTEQILLVQWRKECSPSHASFPSVHCHAYASAWPSIHREITFAHVCGMDAPFRSLLFYEPLAYPLSRCVPVHHKLGTALHWCLMFPKTERWLLVDSSPALSIRIWRHYSRDYRTSAEIRFREVVLSVKPLCSHFTCFKNSGESGAGSVSPEVCILGFANFQSGMECQRKL